MHPTPIPEGDIWEGAVPKVIAPPGGDLTDPDIGAVEAIVDVTELGHRYSMRLALDSGELDALRAGGVVWLQILGARLQPFSVTVAAVDGPPRQTLDVTFSEGSFAAEVVGVPEGDEVLFVRGCIEALEQMLRKAGG